MPPGGEKDFGEEVVGTSVLNTQYSERLSVHKSVFIQQKYSKKN